MREKCCENCLYHEDTRHNTKVNTTCKRFPPCRGSFPIVARKDWCGEFTKK